MDSGLHLCQSFVSILNLVLELFLLTMVRHTSAMYHSITDIYITQSLPLFSVKTFRFSVLYQRELRIWIQTGVSERMRPETVEQSSSSKKFGDMKLLKNLGNKPLLPNVNQESLVGNFGHPVEGKIQFTSLVREILKS